MIVNQHQADAVNKKFVASRAISPALRIGRLPKKQTRAIPSSAAPTIQKTCWNVIERIGSMLCKIPACPKPLISFAQAVTVNNTPAESMKNLMQIRSILVLDRNKLRINAHTKALVRALVIPTKEEEFRKTALRRERNNKGPKRLQEFANHHRYNLGFAMYRCNNHLSRCNLKSRIV